MLDSLERMEEQSSLKGAEKAAAVLFAMGKDTALKLADFFSADELRQLNDAANRLKKLNYETIDSVVKEFGENYVQHGAFAEADDLNDILEVFSSNDDDDEEDDSNLRFGSLKLPKIEQITEFVSQEPAIIGAFLLGTLPDEVAAAILTDLEEEKRNTVFKTYIQRKLLPEEQNEAIKANLISLIKRLNKSDGTEEKIADAAGLINYFSEETSDKLVGFMESDDPNVAAKIKKFIFKFSNIVKLDKASRSRLFDGIESEEIATSLAGVQTELKDAVLDVLSQRNRRMIESELTRGQPAAEDVEKVQRKIANLALSLAKEGKIILPSEDDEK